MRGLKKKLSSRLQVWSFRKKARGVHTCTADDQAAFPLLQLSDDVILHVLSFISYAPFEESPDADLFTDYISTGRGKPSKGDVPESTSNLTIESFGTLTHVLPLVCCKFRDLCLESDILWKDAIRRLATTSPSVWAHGMVQIAPATTQSNPTSQRYFVKRNSFDPLDFCDQSVANHEGSARSLFQRVVHVYQPFTTTAPLFMMGESSEPPVLHQTWHLNIFEPRYRLMMSQIMQNRPVQDKNGWIIPHAARPKFLFASGLTLPLMAGDAIFTVEVVRCKLKRDGRALIAIRPVGVVRVQSLRVRPSSFALVDATVCQRPLVTSHAPLPVLCVAATGRVPKLFGSLGLSIREQRYRALIQEVVQHHQRDHEEQERPRFILAHTGSIDAGEAAMLVEVRKCVVRPDGAAKVDLVPVAKGRLRNVIERPDTDRFDLALIEISNDALSGASRL